MRLVSKTGIAHAFLPKSLRVVLGRTLGRTVKRLSPISVDRAYIVHGNKMYLHPRFGNNHAIVYGTYEEDTVKVFQEIVKPGITVVDVGAHVGFYTLLAAKLVGNEGTVYAFEPQPEVFSILKKNIVENHYEDRVIAPLAAVGRACGKVTLFVSTIDSGYASIYSSENASPIEVNSISLDHFFAERGWPRVDIVKIDAGGDETEIIAGMTGLLDKNPWIRLIVEFDIDNQLKVHGTPEVLLRTLVDLGFHKCYAIRHGLKPISSPDGVRLLLQLTETSRYVNLLCER